MVVWLLLQWRTAIKEFHWEHNNPILAEFQALFCQMSPNTCSNQKIVMAEILNSNLMLFIAMRNSEQVKIYQDFPSE